jgi:phosphosulfolactate synthase (CoM biosynthesis protein A)
MWPKPSYTIACPSIRYDYLRAHQTNFEGARKSSLPFSVLWAGQPEFEVNLATLKTLIPALNELSVTFFFKAHPNDTEYQKGSYEEYFNEVGLRWLDVSSAKIDSSLFDQVHLVITQFSSVAIEAGFYGIPSLNILLEGAGQKLLIERTGCATTSIIDSGASFVITEKRGILEHLKICLTDLSARKKVLANFDRVYETRQTQLPKLLLEIKDIIHTVIKK